MALTRPQFEKLALEQIDLLYRVARRLTHDPTRAEDLVQETYVRAIRSWETFDLKSFGIRPWLIRILHNLHFSHAKRDHRYQIMLEESQANRDPAAHTPPPPADNDIFEQMDQEIAGAMIELPPEYREALQLWAIEDFSYKEIAEAMDIPIGTVMSRLHRARQRLSTRLRDYALREGVVRE